MFAVIQTGGKQYRVAQNDVLAVERLKGEPGDAVEFDRVLMLGEGEDVKVADGATDGARVTAQIVEQARGPKVLIFKKKRRKNYRRRGGHRQDLTVVRITEILAKGEKPKAATRKTAAKKSAAKSKTKAEPAPEADAAQAKED